MKSPMTKISEKIDSALPSIGGIFPMHTTEPDIYNKPEDEWFNGVSGELETYMQSFKDIQYNYEYFYTEDENKVTIVLYYLKCVEFNEIHMKSVWSKNRYESTSKWLTKESSRTVPFSVYMEPDYDGDAVVVRDITIREIRSSFPSLSRDGQFDNAGALLFEKYSITDGIHRTSRARDIDSPCIMCYCRDYITIKKSQTNLYKSK